ncbi:MAG: ABC transporter ATP-binding protein [Thermomicrobiales bacterium]|nr:MAG: ABC transporter ATP-binding protein [Thermomicrobiales bacterium]
MSRLQGQNVTLTYGEAPIVVDTSVEIADGQITTIIGPNGCGKSTLLRGLARIHRPSGGQVVLDGQLIHQLPSREVAKRLGLLAQQASAPEGLTVEDLVRRGRFPHQGFLHTPSAHDESIVEHALHLAGMTELRKRLVDELSGGQRQRAWIAMALAQETPLLLLDEPTTYLDVAHQLEIMDLVLRLNRDERRTIVMVLHDINEAVRVSDQIIAMVDGRIAASGTPDEIITSELLDKLYDVDCAVRRHPGSDALYVVPAPRAAAERIALDGGAAGPSIHFDGLGAAYGERRILENVTTQIPPGKITTIIGPNACGKSTLLRCCTCLLKPFCGRSQIENVDVRSMKRKALARRMAYMAQGSMPPSGFLVEDLVAFGRMPHQGFLRQWRKEDERAVEDALVQCDLCDLRYREIDSLSGGQRQRAWFAMAMAQDTPVLMLDEPTTFLDIGAQIELLEMAVELNRTQKRTIALVLHDMNLAARYSDWIIAMKNGEVVAAGPPKDVITTELLATVFEVEATIVIDPDTNAPFVLIDRKIAA